MNVIAFQGEQCVPSKVVCVGRNYLAHIEELNSTVSEQPVIFIKPNSAISGTLAINPTQPLHYESELSFLIRQGQIVGVGFGLDLTDRVTQSVLKSQGLPWERAKAFDGSAVFSGFVPVEGELAELSLRLTINDQVVQQGGVNLMLHKPHALLDEVSAFLTLEDNDILMTGTPKGVGNFYIGDRFCGQVLLEDQVIIEQSWLVEAKD